MAAKKKSASKAKKKKTAAKPAKKAAGKKTASKKSPARKTAGKKTAKKQTTGKKKTAAKKAAAAGKKTSAKTAPKTVPKTVPKAVAPKTEKPAKPAKKGGFPALEVNMGHVFGLRPRVATSFRPDHFREARHLLEEEFFADASAAARAVAEKALELTHEGVIPGRGRNRRF